MNLTVIEETSGLAKVREEDGNEYWISKDKLNRQASRASVKASRRGETVADGLLAFIRTSARPISTAYSDAGAFEVLKTLQSQGFNVSSLGTLSGAASTLHKNGLIKYANGSKDSGWVAV